MAVNEDVTLADISDDSAGVTLQDINGDVKSNVLVNNKQSNINAAAQASIMTDDPALVEENYRIVNSELDEDLQSDAAKNLVELVKARSMASARSELIKFLADPQYSDQEKEAAANTVLNPDSPMYNPQNLIATESTIADEGDVEFEEREFTRINASDVIFEVQQFKKAKQQLLTQAVAGSDTDTLTATGDFLTSITPFMEPAMASKISTAFEGEFEVSDFLLLGSAKKEIIEAINNAPKDEQLNIIENLIEVVNKNSSVVMQDPNDFARVNFLRTFLEDGYYEDSDVWLDNVVSVLDMTILGGPIASGVRFFRKGSKAVGDVASNASRDAARSSVKPSSVSQVVKDTNVGKARAMHETAALDESGEAAEALYGASREEAVANDILPEIGKTDASVNNKVGNPNLNIVELADESGAIHYTEFEKQQLRADAKNKLVQVNAMTPRSEMFNVEAVADGVKVKAVYGPTQGGVSNAQEALDMAEWALRDFGASEDTLTLLRRDGDEYVPTTKAEFDALVKVGDIDPTKVDVNPDFMVQLNYDYKFNPMDVNQWSELDVKYNLFDRIGSSTNMNGLASTFSSIQRYALDPQSMLDGHLTLAANTAVDQAAGLESALLDLGKGFADGFMKVDKGRQQILEDIIKEQNHKGRVLNHNELTAQGITPAEQQVLRDWKSYWDTTYSLENRDMIRSLTNKGFKEFIDKQSDTRLFVKPLSKQNATPANVYDQKTGELRSIDQAVIDDLYAKGGTLAQLKDPINVAGTQARHILVENAQDGSYLRALNDDSKVLHYREGYYTVNYTDPKFVVQRVKDSDGNFLYNQAIATAGNNKDAEKLIARFKANDAEGEYFWRDDLKGADVSKDDRWDVAMNTGRSVQRARGQRLGGEPSGGIDPSQAPILGPVDSMILSARSTSNRVKMRDFLETSKQRFMSQYPEFLPKNDIGSRTFPNEIKDVQYRGEGQQNNKRLADARTTWEYINYIENGYINAIDDGYKATMKGISNILGNAGATKLGKGAQWLADARGPSAMGKNLAFNMYLATNPLRQLIVQSHQAVQLTANFPKYVASARAPLETIVLTTFQMGGKPNKVMLDSLGMSAKEAEDMFKQFKRSGLVASIDKQNLVRGALADMADEVAKKDFKPLTLVRKFGFDAGENFNMMTAWLAHRYKAIDDGLDMSDLAVQDRVSALARNYTYNMNAAGDLKYNQDSLAAVFQFMQVPHKAMTQMTFNRNLTKGQKARLAGFNALMYTLPPAAMYELYSSMGIDLPEDPVIRDAVVQGLEGVMFNALLNQTMGEGSTDFSGLSPVDMYGTYEFIHNLFTTDIGTTVASTPSGQLFFGNNPRLTNFAKTGARYFNLIEDHQETPTTLKMVMEDFLKLSSGMSNAFKALHKNEASKKVDSLELPVTEREAFMAVFGFGTNTEAAARWNSNKTYTESKELKNDVKEWYGSYKKQLLRDGITPEERDYTIRTFNEAWRVWSGEADYVAREELSKLIKRDLQSKDMRLFNSVMRASGYTTNNDFKLLIDTLPESDKYLKQQLEEILEFSKRYKEE